jgi:ubiquinone/menaquinone biosynthesis C-methylase UbiE
MRTFDCHETERMDRPQPVSDELATTLRDLESMNHRFGGHRYVRRFIAKRFRPGYTYRVLDLATGGGDFPRVMVDWARENRVSLVIDAVDSNEAIIDLAREFSEGYPEIRYQVGNALSFRSPRFYDLVHCSLTMHHFQTQEAVEFLKRCRELSKKYVLVTDLRRSLLTRLGVHFVNSFFGHERMTRKDGDTSARRAFNFREFRMLAKGAGWERFGHERFRFCRQALWLPRK